MKKQFLYLQVFVNFHNFCKIKVKSSVAKKTKGKENCAEAGAKPKKVQKEKKLIESNANVALVATPL